VPAFYRRNEAGVPPDWITRIRASMSTLAPHYSSNRMLRHYIEKIYLDCASHYQRRLANGGQLAQTLQEWHDTTCRYWRELRWGEKRIVLDNEDSIVEVDIYLDGLKPDQVQLQLYADAIDSHPQQCIPMQLARTSAGAIDSYVYTAAVGRTRPPEHFTPRALACHEHALVPQENASILWWQGSE